MADFIINASNWWLWYILVSLLALLFITIGLRPQDYVGRWGMLAYLLVMFVIWCPFLCWIFWRELKNS